MRKKKAIIIAIAALLIFSVPVFAKERNQNMTIFMGEVLEIQKNERDNNLMVRTKGYIKGCEVYKEEIIAIIGDESFCIKSDCSANDKNEFEKIKVDTFNLKVGDNVFMVLNEAMTKSIPPQVGVKLIKVTKIN